MQRRSVWIARSVGACCLVGSALLAAACSDGTSVLPLQPKPPTSADAITSSSCPTHPGIPKQIQALFPPGDRLPVLVAYVDIVFLLDIGNKTKAQQAMGKLWSYTVQEYAEGELLGGTNVTHLTLVFGQSLYCLVGLDPTGLTLGNPNDPGGVATVVPASDTSTPVIRKDGEAGLILPPQPVPTTVVMSANGETLPTPLDVYGTVYE